jgi:hypothetical protein
MNMDKKIIIGSLSLLLVVVLISNVFAITASIGNARMILRAEVGDEIEKSIRVINDNDVAVDILLTVEGDLIDDIELVDEEFRLEPQEEKKAYFKIDVNTEGKTESTINVQFTPVDGKNGAGLSSTVIVIAVGEGELDEEEEEEEEDEDEENEEEEENEVIDNDDEEVDVDTNEEEEEKNPEITGNVIGINKISGMGFAVLTTSIVLLIFIVVICIYYMKKDDKKKDDKKKKVKTKPKKKSKKK